MPSNSGSSIINSFHSDKWKLHLSNFPQYTGALDDARLMSNSYKGLLIPDWSVRNITIPFNDREVQFPFDKRNTMPSISITYRADEGLRNYMACLMWAMGHRCNTSMNGEETQYESLIRCVLFIMCDNQTRPIARMRFKDCQFENLSALMPVMGKMEELDFTLKMKPQGFSYENKVGNQWIGVKIANDGGMEPITSIGI